MTKTARDETKAPGWGRHRRTAIVVAAVIVVMGLIGSLVHAFEAERCAADGQVFDWRKWSCRLPGGVLTLPPGLRRSH